MKSKSVSGQLLPPNLPIKWGSTSIPCPPISKLQNSQGQKEEISKLEPCVVSFVVQ